MFKVAVVPRQESQVSLEARVLRGQQVLQDRPACKDPLDNVATEAMMANQEVKAPRAPKDLLGHWQLIGNSVCGKILTTERTLDWSR